MYGRTPGDGSHCSGMLISFIMGFFNVLRKICIHTENNSCRPPLNQKLVQKHMFKHVVLVPKESDAWAQILITAYHLVRQEHFKYTKEQEEAAGANVRNFNSKVLQDLLPDVAVAEDPPSDSSLIRASVDDLLNHRVVHSSPANSGGCCAKEDEDNLGLCGNVICPVSPIKD